MDRRLRGQKLPARRRLYGSLIAQRRDAGLLTASYTASVSSFTFIGEALFMLWLLLKGRKVTLTA